MLNLATQHAHARHACGQVEHVHLATKSTGMHWAQGLAYKTSVQRLGFSINVGVREAALCRMQRLPSKEILREIKLEKTR